MAEVAKYPDIELTLVVPEHWLQFNKKVNLEKDSDRNYRIISEQPITWGLGNSALRNVTHIYTGIKEILRNVEPDIIEIWEEPFSAVTVHTTFWAKRIIPKSRLIFFSAHNIRKNYPFPFSTFEKYTYKNADYAFLMSEEVASVLRSKGYNKGFRVLPLGVDPYIFSKKDVSSLKKKLGLRDFVIGFMGKIVKQKGILDLIEAISQMNGKIQVLIIGNGDLRGEVEHLVELSGLGGRTILMDAIPHSQVPNYLNCMNVVVFPSITLPDLKEQFGRVIIEGMACEVPAIGSDSGGIPATIGKAGLIFKEKDIAGLKGKIEALIRDRNLRTMLAKNGRKRVLENFSWKVIAEKQHQVYTELMSREK
ncbi:MAG: glycosyltransferase family 4 protein [Candidatus Zixiibacteriota bacterium]